MTSYVTKYHMRDRAKELGRQAWVAGKTLADNPFDAGADQARRDRWLFGFSYANQRHMAGSLKL